MLADEINRTIPFLIHLPYNLIMVHKVFITATDTDAGKTWVAAAAIRSLQEQGIRARALKPVACGLDAAGRNGDIEALLSAQGLTDADQINLYRYVQPAAPSQAARAEGQEVDTERLLQWCRAQALAAPTCLIEGVGGLMTPITDNWLVSDWIAAMPDCEVWLVVGCRLGAINQMLLTLEKLKQMQRRPARIFFNAISVEDHAWVAPTRQAVAPFLHSDCMVSSLNFGDQIPAVQNIPANPYC